ncbi:hydrogenase maturation nickel metallochaperone HypA/HybF [Carboxydothermus pertinax]|uniref:Hydrogenase maturation factor HypA n=1 Tax=Carboxydothermus pertinax TaxID=870242 RepID=A0A1L8CY37_9THEO|nr:hydrogenase maturation nickel metallochaperone HypA [Carboxydothermus pertinax]GAV23784.1 hypothetical protein cpu_22940 [Carboxydothermus pertinax]
MHETALMESVLAILEESARKNGINKITKVKLKVGELTNALPEALELAFEAAKGDLLTKNAVLEIEQVKAYFRCQSCEKIFSLESPGFYCTFCHSRYVKIISGDELLIDYYEGE